MPESTLDSPAGVPFAVGLLGALLVTGSGGAQSLPLPTPAVSALASSREVAVTWTEPAATAGRAISNVNVSTLGSGASTLTFVGQYALDCDYRLRIEKIPADAGFNRHVQLIYSIHDNTSGQGIALADSILDVYEPNVPYYFLPRIAGNLGIMFSPTAIQPTTKLGNITVSIGGLSTSLSPLQNYFATALDSVSTLADTLRVKVMGPVTLPLVLPLPPATPRDTLEVTAAGVPYPIQNGLNLTFTDDSAAPGDTLFFQSRYLFERLGIIRADLEAFEGYHIWRSDLPDLGDMTLLGEISQCESKRVIRLLSPDELLDVSVTLSYDDATGTFTFVDTDIHDDFPYRYAVSTFDRGFLGNIEDLTFEGELTRTDKLYPAPRTRRRTQKAYPVPNPYKERSRFQESGPRIVFANLPTSCTIRIFTAAADYVTTLYHGPGERGSTSATSREWDLRSDRGITVAAGIYIYYIDGKNEYEQPLEGGGSETVSEPFQQYGKLMIAR